MSHNTDFQVTDPVKVYTYDPDSEFYIIGRVFYIDTAEDKKRIRCSLLRETFQGPTHHPCSRKPTPQNAGRESAWVPLE